MTGVAEFERECAERELEHQRIQRELKRQLKLQLNLTSNPLIEKALQDIKKKN